MLKIVVTGKEGQVVRSLTELSQKTGYKVVSLGRPELDLSIPESILPAFAAAKPDVIVNAAAYTAVDQAEMESEQAMMVNGRGAGAVAAAAHQLAVPVIHLSTDYVFNGKKPTPYVEEDATAPQNVYGVSKLAGELAVAKATPNHVILRTAWVYSPYGKNFVLTMLRLAETRPELRVVADQFGAPTYAHDIATAIVRIAKNLTACDPSAQGVSDSLFGLFHLTGTGETNWAEFAAAIFEFAAARGMKIPTLISIGSAEYPTPAKRPANSRLNNTKLLKIHGIKLPPWQDSLRICLERLSPPGN
jgi:dTDP-4-dehydrorhamnose reductase